VKVGSFSSMLEDQAARRASEHAIVFVRQLSPSSPRATVTAAPTLLIPQVVGGVQPLVSERDKLGGTEQCARDRTL
jgi:hypothetical protein